MRQLLNVSSGKRSSPNTGEAIVKAAKLIKKSPAPGSDFMGTYWPQHLNDEQANEGQAYMAV